MAIVCAFGTTCSKGFRPIHTYSGRGTLKPSVDPNTHALIRLRHIDAAPLPGEQLTLDPILVDAAHNAVTLHHASRLNFAHAHTVHYNIPVYELGTVASESMIYLQTYWSHFNG